MRVPSALIALIVAAAAGGCSVDVGGGGINIGVGNRAGEPFRWEGQLAAGRALEIKGVNGLIKARASDGDRVEVHAERTGSRNDPNEVKIEVVEHDGGVTVCAVYPSPDPGEPNVCAPGAEGRSRTYNNDVKVEFTVHVPPGVGFIGRTVNGGVTAESLDGPTEAHTVNGAVKIATTGHARASTVNGSVDATMGRGWTDAAEFKSVNGSITVAVPPDLDAELHATLTNGSITSDLPVKATSSSRRRLEGTIGAGGPELRIETTNGSIRLRAAGPAQQP